MGIFGDIAGYIGAIEAQGQGTLHFHVITWLNGSPTSIHMKELLQNEIFQKKVGDFIATNIWSDIAGGNGAEVRAIKKEKSVSYSWPVDLTQSNYAVCA